MAGRSLRDRVVGERGGPVVGSSGLTLGSVRAVGEIDRTDIVIVPSMAIDEEVDWVPGRYPGTVAWMREMHERGATVCSA